LHDEVLHAQPFGSEAAGKIVRAVLEKDDETKGKEGEENEPEKPAKE